MCFYTRVLLKFTQFKMPTIRITDYIWRQTPDEIIITMPIIGNPTKIDIFAIDNYIKASYPPFILELFLFKNILEEESQCVLGESSAVFTLKKAEINCHWPCLLDEGLTKEKKREYRSQAMERAQLSAEIKAKEKKEKQQELHRKAVRKQIELHTITLNKIDNIRDNHRREAMTEFDNWRVREEKPIFTDAQGIIQPNRKEYRPPLDWIKEESINKNCNTEVKIKSLNIKSLENLNSHNKNEIEDENKNSTNSSENTKSTGKSEIIVELPQHPPAVTEINEEKIRMQNTNEKDTRRGKEIIDKLLNKKLRTTKRSIFEDTSTSVPMPRQYGTINVTFSERVFPTPARESHHIEEQEWLEKQVEARRKYGFASEDLTPEEQDPQWLKDKGDEFFKAANYIAAISAYSHGIKLSDKMTSLYANRSAAHYALGNYRRCAEDSSTALELMIPKCDGNRESRARCHARLGAALCKLGAPQHGIPELEAALKLAPDNDTIKRDLYGVKKYFNIN